MANYPVVKKPALVSLTSKLVEGDAVLSPSMSSLGGSSTYNVATSSALLATSKSTRFSHTPPKHASTKSGCALRVRMHYLLALMLIANLPVQAPAVPQQGTNYVSFSSPPEVPSQQPTSLRSNTNNNTSEVPSNTTARRATLLSIIILLVNI